MANVTVLGAGGSTVTIALSSQQNADLAQKALGTISNLVTSKVLDQVNYAGSGTMPAPANFLGGAVVLDGKQGDVGALTAQYVSAVSNATGPSTIVGPDNFKSVVVLGDQPGSVGNTYLNISSQAEIYFGKGNNFLVQQDGATAYFDAGASVLETGLGATTQANVADGGLLVVQGQGLTTVTANAGANAVVQVQGSATIPVTINGGSGASLTYLAAASAAVINPGAANVTVFGFAEDAKGNDLGFTGSASVFAAGATGKLTVVGGRGLYEAGTVGGSQLFSSTVAGSATLKGGGNGDLLFAQGEGHQLWASNIGSSTLTGFDNAASVGGASFFGSGGGNGLIFGNSGGGNSFFSGAAQNTFDGRNESVLGGAAGAANTYFDFQSGDFDQQFISDFTSGLDKLSGQVTLADEATIQFFAAGALFTDAGTMVTFFKGGAATSQWYAFDANKDGKADVAASDIIGVSKVTTL